MISSELLLVCFTAVLAPPANSPEIALPEKPILRKWLSEDVIYIVTAEERTRFKYVKTDEEREQFIEGFWMRRDPTPESQENEYKQEHYRRIAYANQRFASGLPGWQTDRGMLYISLGPPDEITSHPSGQTYQRSLPEGGGTTATYPFETWRYLYTQQDGTPKYFQIEFVDKNRNGDYQTVTDPAEAPSLAIPPGTQLFLVPAFQPRLYDPIQAKSRTPATSQIVSHMLSVHASPDLYELWKKTTTHKESPWP